MSRIAITIPEPAQVRQAAKAWVRRASALVYPPRCAGCGVETLPDEIAACADCRRGWIDGRPACPRCGRFGPAGISETGCVYFRSLPQTHASVVALGGYDDSLREVVLRLKRPGTEALATTLAELLWRERGPALVAAAPDFVAPVPMHWRRRLIRGANSAARLAERLARLGRWPLAARAVVRRRYTRPQAWLELRQRLRNVRGAFGIGRGVRLEGARVLLVDDVLTTGATAQEASRVLLRHGASAVAVVVLARADRDERSV